MKQITVLGAGLAGSLMAIYLAKRGYAVDIFEARSDPRLHAEQSGKSINLALSHRGISSLKTLGLMAAVEKIIVPMRARAIHDEQGNITYQPFGRHRNEHINAVGRRALNCLILDHLAAFPKARVYFDCDIQSIDVNQKKIQIKKKDTITIKRYQCLLGADGANSVLRKTLLDHQLIQATRTFLPYGYKELSIGQAHTTLVREHLHLWPRNACLLLGNPNPDHSITGSLFLANQGKNSFSTLNNSTRIKHFFKTLFPDALAVMPNLVEEFLTHPTGNMSTIVTTPWYYQQSCLLIGDAAHGMIPFFGQGMNSAFEDCRILNQLLEKFKDDWQQVMPAFYHMRKINTDAVASMSMDNYHEIHTDIRHEHFNFKKQLEQVLMHRYPERYVSKHVLVMFTNTPYVCAQAIGMIQNELLNEICAHSIHLDQIDWLEVETFMARYDNKLTEIMETAKFYQ